jgi:hypothetical protein
MRLLYFPLVCIAVFNAVPAHGDFLPISTPNPSYLTSTTLINFPDPDYTVIHSLSDSNLTITYSSMFNAGISEQTVPVSWSSWCSPPACESSTPRVGFTEGEAEETLTFSVPLKTFGLEIQPDLPETEEITAVFMHGATVLGTIDLMPNGNAGGLLFAATTTTSSFTSVDITDLATEDFAFAEQRYTAASIPEPGAGLLLLLGLLCFAGAFAQRVGRASKLWIVLALILTTVHSVRAQNPITPLYCSPTDTECLNAVTIDQVSFTYPGAEWIESQYGIVLLDYSALNNLGFEDGFINVFQFDDVTGTNPRWVVQNLPILNASVLPGLGSMFDLGAPSETTAAAPPGRHRPPQPHPTVWAIPVRTPKPLPTLPPKLPLPRTLPFTPTAVPWNAQGIQYPRAFQPALPPPAPALTFNPAGKTTDPVVLTKLETIEQEVNQCAPGALNNSLDYLSEKLMVDVDTTLNTFNCAGFVGSNCPPPNATKKSRVGQIDLRMKRARTAATPALDMIQGKIKYITDIALPANQMLTLKHQGVYCDAAGNCTKPDQAKITVGALSSTNAGPVPTMAFIQDEIVNKKADLELAIAFQAGNGLAGHAFHVIAFGTVQDVPYIIYRHDANQGQKGGTTAKDGGFMLSFLVPMNNNFKYLRMVNYPDGMTSAVVNAMAEEPQLPKP